MLGSKPLTRQEREAVASYGLDWKEWEHLDNLDRYHVKIINVNTCETMKINRFRKVNKGGKHAWQQ